MKGGYSQNTVFHCAAKYGEIEIAQWLIEKGANMKAQNGQTALVKAARHKQGLKMKPKDVNALLGASWNGHFEMMCWLAKQGMDINRKGRNGNTPILLAAQKGHLEIVQWLIDQRVDINETNDIGYTALLGAAKKTLGDCALTVQ